MKKLYAILLLALFSCSSKSDSESASAYSFIEDELHEAYLNALYAGEEDRFSLIEMAADKSNPVRAVRSKLISDYLKGMDEEAVELIQYLDSVKLTILEQIADINNENIVIQADEKKNVLSVHDLNLTSVSGLSNTNSILQKTSPFIEKQLLKLRQLFIESVTSSYTKIVYNGDSTGVEFDLQYQVTIPLIDTLRESYKANEEFDAIIENQPLNMNDKFVCSDIYSGLTTALIRWKNLLGSELTYGQAINAISSLQHNIVMHRRLVYRHVSTRIGCCSPYSFTQIAAFIEGAPTAVLNDSIELLVGMMAYDEFKEPQVNINGKVFSEVKDGKCIVRLPADKVGLQKIRGEISLTNKSGIKKVIPWETEVFVLDK